LQITILIVYLFLLVKNQVGISIEKKNPLISAISSLENSKTLAS